MGGNSEHQRILKIPKWLMQIIRHGAHGISFRKQSWIVAALVFVMVEVCEVALYMLNPSLIFLLFVLAISILFGSLLAIIFVFPITIRKDCFNCEFGFHIIAHERTHLRLNSPDEERVETETLKETRNRLIPLLMSNQRTCKGCRFRWYKMLSEATSEYLKEKRAG